MYSSDGIAPALQARENGGQDQSAVMLDFHQQDGRFKVKSRERSDVQCSADSQSNAARCFNLAPTLMAHAGKDAPFIYPTADGRD